MTRYLSLAEVLALYERVVAVCGGASALRDLGALESALAQPRATFDGDELKEFFDALNAGAARVAGVMPTFGLTFAKANHAPRSLPRKGFQRNINYVRQAVEQDIADAESGRRVQHDVALTRVRARIRRAS